MTPAQPASAIPADERVVLRPRSARITGYVVGGLVMVSSITLGIVTYPSFEIASLLMFIAFGVLVFWFCHRQASVVVIAEPDQLIVRNLLETERLEYPEVLMVNFPRGDPWARLELADGHTIATMAIQRTDGELGLRQARLLQTLIAQRGEAVEPPGRE